MQVSGPQVPLLGHGNEIKSPNKRVTHSDACEPWGYVAPVVAAVVTRATGVRHIYLIQSFEANANLFLLPLSSPGLTITSSWRTSALRV